MNTKTIYQTFTEALFNGSKLLAVLLDPDKFELDEVPNFIRKLPTDTTHLFVGGSTVVQGMTHALVQALKLVTSKPILLFPGDVTQLTDSADGLLFLSLLSGRNPEFLIGQQVKAVESLRTNRVEVIPTGYVLIDGGHESAVARVTQTSAMSQDHVAAIVDTAKAGEYMGAKLIYLEAGSGAKRCVSSEIISEVKKEIDLPIIVGGGIRTEQQRQAAYDAGATMVVMGTVFEIKGDNT